MATSAVSIQDVVLRLSTIVQGAQTLQQAQQNVANFAATALNTANVASKAEQEISAFVKSIGAVYAAQQFANLTQGIISLADSYTLLLGKLNLVKDREDFGGQALSQVIDIAKNTSTALSAVGTSYSRMALATKASGATLDTVAALTETVNKALFVSSASASEATSTLRQFTQAMASGVVRGDEFNSLMENAPALMSLVADSLGATTGKLRELAEAGQLSTSLVANAILSQKGVIDDAFGKIPKTIELAMLDVNNAIALAVGGFDQFTGASRLVVGVLDTVSNNMGLLLGILGGAALAVMGRLSVAAFNVGKSFVQQALGATSLALANAKAAASSSELALANAKLAYSVAAKNAQIKKSELDLTSSLVVSAAKVNLANKQAIVAYEQLNIAYQANSLKLKQQTAAQEANAVETTKGIIKGKELELTKLATSIATEKETIAVEKNSLALANNTLQSTKLALKDAEAALAKELLTNASRKQAISEVAAAEAKLNSIITAERGLAAANKEAIAKNSLALANNKLLLSSATLTEQDRKQLAASINLARAKLDEAIADEKLRIAKVGLEKEAAKLAITQAKENLAIIENTNSAILNAKVTRDKAIADLAAADASVKHNITLVEKKKALIDSTVSQINNTIATKEAELAKVKLTLETEKGVLASTKEKIALLEANLALAQKSANSVKAEQAELELALATEKNKEALLKEAIAARVAQQAQLVKATQDKVNTQSALTLAAANSRLEKSFNGIFSAAAGASIGFAAGEWINSWETAERFFANVAGRVGNAYSEMGVSATYVIKSIAGASVEAEEKILESNANILKSMDERIKKRHEEEESAKRIEAIQKTEAQKIKEKIELEKLAADKASELYLIQLAQSKAALKESENAVQRFEAKKANFISEINLAEELAESLRRETIARIEAHNNVKKHQQEELSSGKAITEETRKSLALDVQRAELEVIKAQRAEAEHNIKISTLNVEFDAFSKLNSEFIAQLQVKEELLALDLRRLKDSEDLVNISLSLAELEGERFGKEAERFNLEQKSSQQRLDLLKKEQGFIELRLKNSEVLLATTLSLAGPEAERTDEVKKQVEVRVKETEELKKRNAELSLSISTIEKEIELGSILNANLNAKTEKERESLDLNAKLADAIKSRLQAEIEASIILAKNINDKVELYALEEKALTQQLALSNQRIEQVKAELALAKSDLAAIQAKAQAAQNFNKEVTNTINALKEKIAQSEAELAIAEKEKVAADVAIQNNKVLVNSLQAVIDKEKEKLDILNDKLDNSADIIEATAKQAKAEGELAGKVEAVKKAEEDRLNALKENVKARIILLEQQLVLDKKELESILAKAGAEEKWNEAIRNTIKALRDRVAETTVALKEAAASVAEYELQLKQINTADAGNQLNGLVDVVKDADESVKTYTSNLGANVAASVEAATGYKLTEASVTELNKAMRKLGGVSSEIGPAGFSPLKAILDNVKDSIIDNISKFRDLSEEVNSNKLNNTELQAALLRTKIEFNRLNEADVSKLRNEIQGLIDKNNELSDSIRKAIADQEQRKFTLAGDELTAKRLQFAEDEKELLKKIKEEENEDIKALLREQLRALKDNNAEELRQLKDKLKEQKQERDRARKEEETTGDIRKGNADTTAPETDGAKTGDRLPNGDSRTNERKPVVDNDEVNAVNEVDKAEEELHIKRLKRAREYKEVVSNLAQNPLQLDITDTLFDEKTVINKLIPIFKKLQKQGYPVLSN